MLSSRSSTFLSAVVLIPLLVLGVLAWLGTRAQVRAAWSAARDEAKLSGAVVANLINRELATSVEEVPLFPDPPVPGTGTEVDSDDLDELRRLRDDSDAGISPSGLPRRVLAAFRVFEMTQSDADRDRLLIVATQESPSILTPVVLEKTAASQELQQRWQQGEHARAVFHRHPELPAEGAWIFDQGEIWWLRKSDDGLSMIHPARIQQIIREAKRRLPTWAELRIPGVAKSGKGEVMERAALDFPGERVMEIVAVRPELFQAAAREQARWTMGLLGFAVLISAGGLWLIQRTMERERRLNAMKSDFVASVSHELRAPVASIRLMADTLKAGKIESQTVREFHELISREGARLSALIENVLDFARIEQGRKEWDFEPTDLVGLVDETVDLMVPLGEEKQVSLVFQKPAKALMAHVDSGAIRQVLVNLLDNAIKFSPQAGEVRVSLDQMDSEWRIAVADDGPGIAAADHARIFERFQRLGGELRRETQGTGIGLSLVKAIVEAHGGRVSLRSEPGRGSTFTLDVPREMFSKS
ncbi:HAMP domain-containing histidine kinase [Luteolibacter pohnpeiensis]|uniref:histidine kinase n=1 Tax=Luteolibacter pohnpeiensis TaxID=454153 RepID=A0A934VVV2_9BACT|nr:HAMP domain-containing sensor histidine kinase [Luteolibacter pohnpeiensis]MBK1881884.1 HAMP domain-containing histidine kinase [Luteolibacter pohnpeiensis]